MSQNQPARDEYEITVFGAGFGECIVVHVGQGDWLVIDSCYDGDAGARTPAAVSYLKSIGVNIATQVKLIVATHWHEDHIKGIADLFRQCRAADFALPTPFSGTLVQAILAAAKASPVSGTTAVTEMADVFVEIARRRQTGQQCERIFCHAGVNVTHPTMGKDLEILALSPSNEVVAKSQQWVVERFPTTSHVSKVRVPETNDISVAMWIKNSDLDAVFGADLEDSKSTDRGWPNVVSRFAHKLSGAEFIKIPHHGSPNAHNSDFWARMLKKKPLGIVTSYNKGKSPLPSKEDLRRLYAACEKIYAAGGNKNASRGASGIQHLHAIGIKTQIPGYYTTGRITIRRKAGSKDMKWKASTNGRASQINGTIMKAGGT